MAVFKNGAGVQSVLTDIITNSEKELFLISPYLKIPVQTKNYLKSIDKKNVPITVIYRSGSDFKLSEEDLNFFKELMNLKLYSCDNLHSKCYLNEKDGLITSMNLHEHSQTHNWEMGIRFNIQTDKDIFNEVKKELSLLQSQAKLHTLTKKEPETRHHDHNIYNTPQKTVYKPKEAPNKGMFTKMIDSVIGEEAYCIRCGHSMDKYNLEQPLCNNCLSIWVRHKNIKYPEKHCHACGELKSNISFEKPTCYECFNRLHKK